MHGFTHQSASGLPCVAYKQAADVRSAQAIKDFFVELFGS